MKPNNLLLCSRGQLKLADFGMAMREDDAKSAQKSTQLTLWYRAPELLFGATRHDSSVDMWAVGCIAVELFLRRVFLHGSNEFEQIERTFQILGTPTDETWPVRLISRARGPPSLTPRSAGAPCRSRCRADVASMSLPTAFFPVAPPRWARLLRYGVRAETRLRASVAATGSVAISLFSLAHSRSCSRSRSRAARPAPRAPRAAARSRYVVTRA